MKKLLVVMFILSVTLFVHQYGEAAVSGLQQGKSELGGYADISGTSSTAKVGSYSSTSTSSSTSLGFTYGYFLTDAIQLSGRLFAVGTESSGTTTSTTYTYLEGKYHFYEKGQELVPYLGLGLGGLSIKSGGVSGSGSSVALMGGLKFFISENTSINPELNISSNSYSMSGAEITAATTRLFVGFSLYF